MRRHDTTMDELGCLERELQSLVLVETVHQWLQRSELDAASVAPPPELAAAAAVAERMQSLIANLPGDALCAIADFPRVGA